MPDRKTTQDELQFSLLRALGQEVTEAAGPEGFHRVMTLVRAREAAAYNQGYADAIGVADSLVARALPGIGSES